VLAETIASLPIVKDDSPRTLREYDAALGAFLVAYREYLDARGEAKARARVVKAIPAASAALRALGFDLYVLPPPVIGGAPIRGLHNVAFLHEAPGWGTDAIQRVIDMGEEARVEAGLRLGKAQRRRRNPLYWGDRLLRAVLGFPVYLVGLILRIPPERLDASAWGIVLRVLGLVAEIALVVIGGRQVGWW
jgi:hypothetical protein